MIELTTRCGHRNTNKKVADAAIKNGCSLILNTDSHEPDDLLDKKKIESVISQCSLDKNYYDILRENSLKLVEKIRRKRK